MCLSPLRRTRGVRDRLAGDASVVAFDRVRDAVLTAADIQRAEQPRRRVGVVLAVPPAHTALDVSGVDVPFEGEHHSNRLTPVQRGAVLLRYLSAELAGFSRARGGSPQARRRVGA
jgi:hypothetical protein